MCCKDLELQEKDWAWDTFLNWIFEVKNPTIQKGQSLFFISEHYVMINYFSEAQNQTSCLIAKIQVAVHCVYYMFYSVRRTTLNSSLFENKSVIQICYQKRSAESLLLQCKWHQSSVDHYKIKWDCNQNSYAIYDPSFYSFLSHWAADICLDQWIIKSIKGSVTTGNVGL